MPAPSTHPAWVFDNSPIPDPQGFGERAVRFLRNLTHPKSGRRFQLDRWQERIVRAIYGPRNPDGTRIVKTVVLLLPRGNRKTSLSAALALLHTLGPERVPGGEVLSAASDRKQARLAFAEALGLVRAEKRLAAITAPQDYRNRLTNTKHGSFYEAISCDAGTQHGRTPVFVLADELHAWKKRDLWDVLKSGLVKTPGSLLVVATTAGRGQENVAHDLVDYARKVARGDFPDPATLPVLFEASADEDWRDEAVWHRVNPGLSCSPAYPDLAGLRQLAKEAENRPGDREAFRQLNLNVWLDHSADPFVEMAIFDEGAQPLDLDALKGRPCWLGVDLSSAHDLTAIIAAWRDDEGGFIVRPWFFCPADNLRQREDVSGAPYVRWAGDGLITPTPGEVIDHRAVEWKIRELCAEYDVREIAFDPYLARTIQANLLEDGLPAVDFRQVPSLMMGAIQTLEVAIVGRKLQHGGHEVLRWNFANVEVEANSQGHKVRFKKTSRHDCIDGAVATAMAVARAAAGEGMRVTAFADESIDISLFALV